jgi:hypothetical protein
MEDLLNLIDKKLKDTQSSDNIDVLLVEIANEIRQKLKLPKLKAPKREPGKIAIEDEAFADDEKNKLLDQIDQLLAAQNPKSEAEVLELAQNLKCSFYKTKEECPHEDEYSECEWNEKDKCHASEVITHTIEAAGLADTPLQCNLHLNKKDCDQHPELCVWDDADNTCYDVGVPEQEINWPPIEGNNFEQFTLKYFNAVKDQVNLTDNTVRYCENDPFNKGKFSNSTHPSVEQQLAAKMITPHSPYNGALIYHEVGTGKTRLGLKTLSNFRGMKDVRLIWITTIRAEKSIHSQKSDFPSFSGSDTDPFVTGPSATAKSHANSKIAIFTYIKFVNALNRLYDLPGEKNDYGHVLRERQKETGDAFSNTVIIVDEAHKIFEEKNGAGAGQYLLERAAYESYEAAKKNGTRACRWVFLTATPMPTIEVPTDERKPELAGGPQAPFRLLNMLIPNKADRLPLDHAGIQKMSSELKKEIPDNFASLKGKEYAEKAKGLVGYFKPHWPTVFADVEGENALTTVKINDKQVDNIKIKLAKTCASAIAKKDAIKIAKCYLRRLHWYGKQLGPKSSEGRSTKKKVLAKGSLPGDLARNCNTNDQCVVDKTNKLNHLNIPRAKELYDTIKNLDAADMQKYGKKFKHVIYSSMKNYTADMYASALVLASNEDPTNKTKIVYQEPAERYKDIGLEYKSKDIDNKPKPEKIYYLEGNMDTKKALEHDVLFFKNDDLTEKQVDVMIKGFNDHERNANGEIARFMILGAGSKEALSLFDVKYVHIMEHPLTSTDKSQIIGRARRYCGHIGIPNEARIIKVLIYGLEISQKALNLRAQSLEDQDLEKAELSKIAQSVIKTDKTLSEQLQSREKILNWMRLVAFDSMVVGMKNDAEVKDKLKETEKDLDMADKSQAAIDTLTVKRYTQLEKKSKMTIAQLKEECKKKEAFTKPPSKAKKDQLLLCCGPDVTPANVPPECKPKEGKKLPPAIGVPQAVTATPQADDKKKKKKGAYSAKQLIEMCKNPARPGGSIPLRSTIKTVDKLEQCCAPSVTKQEAAARDCISGKELKKLGITAVTINQPAAPVAPPQPKKKTSAPPAAPVTQHKISPAQLEMLQKLCPDKGAYASHMPNQKAKQRFLEMCQQLAKKKTSAPPAAPVTQHKIPPAQLEILQKLCPDKGAYASHMPNQKAKQRFLEMCQQLGY